MFVKIAQDGGRHILALAKDDAACNLKLSAFCTLHVVVFYFFAAFVMCRLLDELDYLSPHCCV